MTGRTGFKGSWLYLWLRSMGAVVTGYSIGLVGTPSMFEVADVGRKIHSLFVDICDGAKLTATIRAARPEIVIHMAAQSIVRYAYNHSAETFSTNVIHRMPSAR